MQAGKELVYQGGDRVTSRFYIWTMHSNETSSSVVSPLCGYAPLFHDRWGSHGHRPRWHISEHDGVRSDDRVVANLAWAEDTSACANRDIVTQSWVFMFVIRREFLADRGVLENRTVASHDCAGADHNSARMEDE
jgi:hypothetical protein